MKIRVKSWWYQKEQTKAQKYDWTLMWGEVYKDKKENYLNYPIFGSCPFEVCGHYVVGEKIKETEKAIQCRLKFWNLRKAGRYVTDAPVEDKWVTWIPKSVLL